MPSALLFICLSLASPSIIPAEHTLPLIALPVLSKSYYSYAFYEHHAPSAADARGFFHCAAGTPNSVTLPR